MKASGSGTPTSRTSAGAARASTSDHFELFGLEPAYALDRAALEQAYRDLQALIHPDRFASAGDAERRASLQMTTRVNEAYQTLRDPVQRAKYLLGLKGVDVAFETNTQMPTDFLLQQLEMREELEGAVAKRDFAFLDSLGKKLAAQKSLLEDAIGESIDTGKEYEKAAEQTRKLMFLQKIGEEIDAAYEDLE